MKKLFAVLFVFSIALLFLAGCAKTQPVAQEPAVAAPKEAPAKTVEPTPTKAMGAPVETPAEPEPAQVMSKDMKALLQKHVGRVTSLKYMYQDQTNKPEEWETWVTGSKMHVKLRELDNVRGDVYVDSIYIDLASKSAKAYCEMKVYRCADPNSAVDVNFNKYYRKTPIEWIESVTYAEKLAEEQMQMRTVWKIQYTDGPKTVTMWVDDYYGVPVKIRVAEGGAVNDYNFEDIAFNSVEDTDLDHNYVTVSYN
jgi:hypothetical protein